MFSLCLSLSLSVSLSLCVCVSVSQDIHSQGEVIACLEKALVREAEQQDLAHPIRDECKKSIMRVAELSSDDFHLDRYLYFSCREDRERFCENVRQWESVCGRVCVFLCICWILKQTRLQKGTHGTTTTHTHTHTVEKGINCC